MTFAYRRPRSLGEAHDMLRSEDAVALAGGTDLLVAVRNHAIRPSLVVDLKSVPEIDAEIAVTDDRLRIGGKVTMNRIVGDLRVGSRYPALVDAAAVVGSVQIRNRATLAGNLCNASPAADTVPPLLAYGAEVTVAAAGGVRTVPLSAFFLGPGRTILEPGEVVTGVELPLVERHGSAFARVTRRRGVDLATVNLACVVTPSGRVRFGFGAVGPTPLVAEAHLDELDDAGWARLLAITSPISDVRAGADYRRAMLEVHARRALSAATARMEA